MNAFIHIVQLLECQSLTFVRLGEKTESHWYFNLYFPYYYEALLFLV